MVHLGAVGHRASEAALSSGTEGPSLGAVGSLSLEVEEVSESRQIGIKGWGTVVHLVYKVEWHGASRAGRFTEPRVDLNSKGK